MSEAVRWQNGYVTDNLKLAQGQRECFEKGDYKTYLSLNYIEDRYNALEFLLKHGIKDRFYWNYVYTYDVQNCHKLLPLLPYFSENVSINVKPNKDGFVTIFRGMRPTSAPATSAFSWTTSRKTAEYFAKQEGCIEGYVVEGEIYEGNILGQIDLRKEHEVIVNPSNVTILSQSEVYPLITQEEVLRFHKRAKTTTLKQFLVYSYIKERTKYYSVYLQCMQHLDELEKELLKEYGNFYALNNYHFNRRIGTVPNEGILGGSKDINLMVALREVTSCLQTGTWNTKSTILTRYRKGCV